MIVLPEEPDRLNMASFLISFGILLTLTVCLVFWFISGQILFIAILGTVCTLVLVSIGLVRQNSLLRLNTAWNSVAKKYALFLHHWVSFVSFYLIITAAGRFGKDDTFSQVTNGQSSNWESKTTLKNDTYRNQCHGNTIRNYHNSTWIGSFIKSDTLMKNKWMIFLLPHLLLLRISKVKDDKKSQQDIYTLY